MEGLENYTPEGTLSEDKEAHPPSISSAAIGSMQGFITSDKDPETSNIEGVTQKSQQDNFVNQTSAVENEPSQQPLSNEAIDSIQGIKQKSKIAESSQDKENLVTGLEMMSALKRSKGDIPSAIKWEKMGMSLSNRPEIPTHVPKYDKYDGHELSIEEQLTVLGEKVRIPNFDSKDGHPLSSDEKLENIKRQYNIE